MNERAREQTNRQYRVTSVSVGHLLLPSKQDASVTNGMAGQLHQMVGYLIDFNKSFSTTIHHPVEDGGKAGPPIRMVITFIFHERSQEMGTTPQITRHAQRDRLVER